jgi:hypothetical protein
VSKADVIKSRAEFFSLLISARLLMDERDSMRYDRSPAAQAQAQAAAQAAQAAAGPNAPLPAAEDMVNGDTKVLESTIIHSVRALLLLGGINESKLEDPILDFLHRMPLRGDHVDAAVIEALTMFLRMNPHRLRDFIRRSSIEAHTKQHMINMRGTQLIDRPGGSPD